MTNAPVHCFAYELSIKRLVELSNILSKYFRFPPDPRKGSSTVDELKMKGKQIFFHVAEMLCKVVLKEIFTSDGLGLKNLWTN